MQQRQKEKVTFWELFVVAELFNNLLTIAQRHGIGTRQIEMKSNSTSSSRIKQLQAKSPNGMCQSVCVGVCKCLSCCVSLPPSCSYICLCMFSDILNQTCVEGIKLWEAHTHITPVDICTEVSYDTASILHPPHLPSLVRHRLTDEVDNDKRRPR